MSPGLSVLAKCPRSAATSWAGLQPPQYWGIKENNIQVWVGGTFKSLKQKGGPAEPILRQVPPFHPNISANLSSSLLLKLSRQLCAPKSLAHPPPFFFEKGGSVTHPCHQACLCWPNVQGLQPQVGLDCNPL